MNKTIVFIACIVSIVLINIGMSTKVHVENLRDEYAQLKADNSDMTKKIKYKEFLIKHAPIPLSTEYSLVMNQIKFLESYSGTSMNVQLEEGKDTEDISEHYVGTEYKRIRGLKIKIVVDKFSKETDMGAILDDIHLLEKNTDFMTTEIRKDNNNLIVKGELYGI